MEEAFNARAEPFSNSVCLGLFSSTDFIGNIMREEKITSKIKESWALGEDRRKLKDYYQKWASSYDDDVAREQYFAPKVAIDLILELYHQRDSFRQPNDQVKEQKVSLSTMKVLDAGCGTGLVGALLAQVGARQISGFDLSAEMVAQAKQKNIYDKLLEGVDITQPLVDQIDASDFDLVTCIGVLTQGHVPPLGLDRLIEVTRVNGYVVLNARDTYVREHDFKAYCDGLQDEGRLKFLHCEYHLSSGDSQALFVVAQRLK